MIVNIIKIKFLFVDWFLITRNRMVRFTIRAGHRLGKITRITTLTGAYLTALSRKLCLAHFFRYLTKTRFTRLRKSFHALSTTTIFRIEFFIMSLIRLVIDISLLRFILWIFSSTNIIFDRATFATTSLATAITDSSASLT